MKQKTIKTYKATALVVELPDGSYYPNICQLPPNIGINYFLYENGVNTPYKEPLNIPKGNWQLLGRLPDITEEQADKIVDEYTYNTGEIDGYYDYENDTQTDCPIESLNSLMYTNDVYFENKYGDEPIMTDEYYNDGGEEKWELEISEWREAQSKVWDKERTYLFIKVD